MDLSNPFQSIVVALASFQLLRILYVYWKLRHIPGPFLAALSNLPHFFWVLTEEAHLIHKRLHGEYGPLVRIGPLTVSINDPDVIQTIYPARPGFLKVRDTRTR